MSGSKVDHCPPGKKKKRVLRFSKTGQKKKIRFSLLLRLKKITSQLSRQIRELSLAVSRLRSDVNLLLVRSSGLRENLSTRLNTQVTLETDAGPISGTLIELGTNYVAVLEPTGAIVLIPLSKINFVG